MARTTKRATTSSEDIPSDDAISVATEPVSEAMDEGAAAVADTQTLDTAPQSRSPDPVSTPPKPERRGLSVVLGGVLAAGIGFGLAQFVPNGWLGADTSALDASVQAQAQEIAALKETIAALTAQEPAAETDLTLLTEAVAGLAGRITALENSAAEVPDLAGLRDAMAKLEADFAALKTAGPGAAAATALAAEAEARLKEAEAQAAQMKAEAEALTKAATSRAALGRLQAALDNGSPFTAILPDLGVDVPAALADHAETGLPSLERLKSSFPEVARAALDASLRADMGDTWSERATSFLFSQTGARSLTPREGGDPDAILSRAEAALTAGDLELTLTELAAMPEVAQAPLADWRALAEQRQAGLKAMADVASKIEG